MFMATSSVIVQSYLKTFFTDKKKAKSYKQKVKELLRENKGKDFFTPLNYHCSIVEKLDPVQFPFMNEVQRAEALRQLQVTFLLLLAQKQYELDHQKTENSKTYTGLISKCHQLIGILQYEKVCKKKKIKPSPEQGYATEGNPVKYLGIFFAQWIGAGIMNFMNGKTKTIKEHMGSFNVKRLYWVWGSGLIKTFLELLPPDFWNVEQGKKTIRMPNPYTGTLSWALYYFRFSLNLSLLLKHTLAGPWMSEAEKSIPWQERFLTQWDLRKFALLNDFFWATGNLLCFILLVGELSEYGDLLTLFLLTFDIMLAAWEFIEEETKYNEEMLHYESNIRKLKRQLEDLRRTSEQGEDHARTLREYQFRLNALEKAQNQCQREWQHKKITLIINISYAIGLMLSFRLLASPFMPALTFGGPVGVVLCFVLTVLCNAVKGGMEIHKTKQSIGETKKEIKNGIEVFKSLMKENSNINDNEKKFLFLEIKKLTAGSEFEQQQLSLQTAHLIRSTIFETLVPGIILANLVFLPMGPAFWGVLGGVIALAFLTNLIINQIWSSEKETLKPFDIKEYQAFCQAPEQWFEKTSKTSNFFSEKQVSIEEAPQEEAEDNLDLSFLNNSGTV